MEQTIENLVERLELIRHPEGGWYRETYRSSEIMQVENLPQRFGGDRSFSTAIYFLLGKDDISVLHRIKSDEMWHFYSGATLTIHVFSEAGGYRTLPLGSDLADGAACQVIVPAGCWFGAEVTGTGNYSLIGCTVAPGFDFADFEIGKRGALLQQFPSHGELIRRLTHA